MPSPECFSKTSFPKQTIDQPKLQQQLTRWLSDQKYVAALTTMQF